MRSALGIRRIAKVEARQVMHATDADILQLQRIMTEWHVPQFRAWPWLLSALTPPRISNWVERIPNVKKRSLSPSTLELLGDRVVETAVPLQLLRGQTWPKEYHSHFRVAYAPRLSNFPRGLVGNRGMALVARQIGIDQLLRWKKPLPTQAHRSRFDQGGFDLATEFACSTEFNAFSKAFEAVAAAVCLDCASTATTDFVTSTLLRRVEHVRNANAETPHLEERLVRHVGALVKQQVDFVTTPKRRTVNTFKPFECHTLNPETKLAENRAHDVFDCAVALSKREEKPSNLTESDFISLASHFSVEAARITALTQAIGMLSGRTAAAQSSQSRATTPVQVWFRNAMRNENQQFLEAPCMDEGRWKHHADHPHLANDRQPVQTPRIAGLDMLDAAQIQQRMQSLRSRAENEDQHWNDQGRNIYNSFECWLSTVSHA